MLDTDLDRLKQATIDSFEAFFRGRADPPWPLEVFVEVSNLCNLTCAMCGPFSGVNPHRHQALASQRRGFLEDGALAALEPVLTHALYVHAFGYGEPTLHPEFATILQRLSRFRVMTDFITNGMRLTPALCEAVVEARTSAVTISMSGATRSDYEGVYLGGRFDTVLQGIRRLADTRAKAGRRYPKITVNSIAFRHHIDSLPAFVDLAAEHGVDIIEVKKLMDDVPAMAGHGAPFRTHEEGALIQEARRRADRHGMVLSTEQFERESGSEAAAPLIPIRDLSARARAIVQEPVDPGAVLADVDALEISSDLEPALGIAPLSIADFGTEAAFYCLEPFKTMYLRRNGLVKPCCFARDEAPALGNVMHRSPEEVWQGHAYRTLRDSIASARYPKAACGSCIRRGTGPKRNVIRQRIRDYVTWARDGGAVLRVCAGADVAPSSIIAARINQREFATLTPLLRRNNAFGGSPAVAADVDIILPVHDAVAELGACLRSLALHTSHSVRLILIDDGSRDQAVGDLLNQVVEGAQGATVIRRPDNQGFVRTVNEGFALSSAPYVVILNSDTVVTRHWLENLVATARSRPDVATVTPLTNNGTLCSVPDLTRPNGLPPGYDADAFADLIDARSLRLFPEVPTGVGFCMLITRLALRRVGRFDAAFGAGYGEENDFCQRAIRAGLVNLIDDRTFVYHAGRASFGDSAEALTARNLDLIGQRYPNYRGDVEAFYRDDPLAAFRADISAQAARLAGAPPVRRIRVLHLLHRGGGTEAHARDVARIEDPDIVSYVSTSDGRQLDIDEYVAGVEQRSWSFPLESTLGPCGPLRDEGYRRTLLAVCAALRIDLVHVHHLIHNTLDVADVAATLGIPYVVTLHDYYLLCPMYTLLDPSGHACGACVGRKPREAVQGCMGHVGQSYSYLADYQRQTEKFLNDAACVFAPNARVREIFGERFPALHSRVNVVEHGHRWPTAQPESQSGGALARSREGSRLNVAIIGGLEAHKGLDAVRSLLRANRRRETVFHLYGGTPDRQLRGPLGQQRLVDGTAFIYHGPYRSHEIVARLRADDIHVGLHLSVWEETFSFTLSELAAAGVPVISGDLGAQGERVRRCALGWTVPDPTSPGPILKILDDILDMPQTLDDAVAAMQLGLALPKLETMWETYAGVYREFAPAPGGLMESEVELPDALVNRDYMLFLASRSSRDQTGDAELREALESALAETAALRERLRSPRHRVADVAAGVLHRIPILWPLVARVTDAVLRRQQRRRAGS